MERTNCPNCGAPLTGCRCEYCGTVDTSAEKRMREDIQRVRDEIDNLMFADQIRRSVNHFIPAGLRPTPPSPPTKKIGDEMLDYTIHNPAGELVLQAPESCRYSRQVELELLAAGYTIRLHGRKITKKELTENVKNRR